jgi:hypothetical protein
MLCVEGSFWVVDYVRVPNPMAAVQGLDLDMV